MYDRNKYLRRKNRTFKRALLEGTEQYTAYDSIRNKWDFDDKTIADLLRENTVTEIIEGSYEKGIFRPKELINLKGLLAILAIILSFVFHNHSVALEKQLAISPETINQP